jgi:hypothetical protein
VSFTRSERELIDEARRLEERRIDLLVQAAETRVMDMLPATWLNMEDEPETQFVEITFTSAMTTADVRLMKARELREFALFVAGLVEERLAWARIEAQEDEDS